MDDITERYPTCREKELSDLSSKRAIKSTHASTLVTSLYIAFRASLTVVISQESPSEDQRKRQQDIQRSQCSKWVVPSKHCSILYDLGRDF